MIKVDKEIVTKAANFRKELHRYPELAHEEEQTSKRVVDFIGNYNPDKVISGIAGNGLAFIFNGKKPGEGPTVAIRCELDALPIQEDNTGLSYKSKYEGRSHKCGHDGHMSILAGLAAMLSKNPVKRGKVVLLFQPAEEVGEGALFVKKDNKFRSLRIDYLYALHNLPGYRKGRVVLKKDTFAAGSKGMIFKLKGQTTHAAHPENGRNPSLAVARLIQELDTLSQDSKKFEDYTLITIIHVHVGEQAFGTSPGEGAVMATLRAFNEDDMQALTESARRIAKKIAKKSKLHLDIDFTETFPVTKNDEEALDILKKAMKNHGIKTKTIRHPFRWSEDFGYFSGVGKIVFFGLGSGLNQYQLHHSKFNFPDSIIGPGIQAFYAVIDEILNKEEDQ